jgi:hypothetical protein
VGFTSSGQIVKHALAELIGRGCRVDTVAYDPPVLRYRTADGARCALVVEGDTVLVDRPDRSVRFHSLRSALQAAVQPLTQPAAEGFARLA